ncbi:MAG: ParA family protein [Bacteroidota bacterium]
MPAISIVNQKGGTGKTTTTINLSVALSNLSHRVLIVDMDPQGNLGYSFGIHEGKNLVDVLLGEAEVSESIQEQEGVSIISSDMRLVDLELSIAEQEDRHQILHGFLGPLFQSYDYIFFDCPPSLSVLSINALYASEYVIIPMLMEVLSLQGLDQIIDTIDKVKNGFSTDLQILGILAVMVDQRRKLTDEVRQHIKDHYDVPIFSSFIRNNVKASEAPSFGKSVISYAATSNSSKDYQSFAKELSELI